MKQFPIVCPPKADQTQAEKFRNWKFNENCELSASGGKIEN